MRGIKQRIGIPQRYLYAHRKMETRAATEHVNPKKIDLTHTNDANPIGFRDTTEVYTRHPCEVLGRNGENSGKIPEFLDGHYFKQTGAAFASTGLETALLDGLAGITSFHLDGKANHAVFSNTILDQQNARDYIASRGRERKWVGTAGESTDTSTLMDKARIWLNSIATRFMGADPSVYSGANPNVVIWKLVDSEHPSLVYPAAATEADGTVLRFDKDTLETVGPVATLKPENKSMVITTPAHYYETVNNIGPYHIALEMEMKGYFPPEFTFTYAIYKGASAPFKRVTGKQLAKFSYGERSGQPIAKRAGYMHCYAQTENYLILFVSRNRLMYEKLLARDFSKGFFGLFAPENIALEMMVFKINRAATSVDKELDYVGIFSDKTTMMHIWHMSNAYELDSNTLVIDASGTEAIYTPSFMSRITISLDSGNVKIVTLCPELQLEFPQANPLVNFHDYRFAYVLKNAGTTSGSLVKLDVRENKVAAEAFNVKGYLLAEPVFVPRLRKYGALTQEEEEDGAILLVVTDTRIEQPTAGHSWLSILAPSDLSEIARISCPITINAGLHSNFLPTVPLVSKV